MTERRIAQSNPVLMAINVSYAGDEVLIDVSDKKRRDRAPFFSRHCCANPYRPVDRCIASLPSLFGMRA